MDIIRTMASRPVNLLLLASQLFIQLTMAFECLTSCSHPASTLPLAPAQSTCLLVLPDNPARFAPKPCQLTVLTNCSRSCHIRIEFISFSRPSCHADVMMIGTDRCHMPECEYAVIEELDDQQQVLFTNVMEGNVTSQVLEIHSNSIRLSMCYSANTFTSRNTHITLTAIEADAKKKLYLGPKSVWILCAVVVVLLLAIGVVAKCKILDTWLNPPQGPGFSGLPAKT